jgi:hypothetical protein
MNQNALQHLFPNSTVYNSHSSSPSSALLIQLPPTPPPWSCQHSGAGARAHCGTDLLCLCGTPFPLQGHFGSGDRHYKKSIDPWRNSHDVFDFVIHHTTSMTNNHSQCWIWSPIWNLNTMTLCQFRHRFRHTSHCIHDNNQISSNISSVGYEARYEVQTLWRCTNFVIIWPTLHFNISSWSII